MTKWQLRYWPDPLLRQHSKAVEAITDEIKTLVQFMIECIDQKNGIGLSAIQLGVALRIFVLRDYIIHPDEKWTTSEPKVYINPKILWKSEELEADIEGCLSLPGLRVGPIDRPFQVKIEATDLQGNLFVEEKEGMNARVIFHENDHLNGVLHIDRLTAKTRKKLERELSALKKMWKAT